MGWGGSWDIDMDMDDCGGVIGVPLIGWAGGMGRWEEMAVMR